MNGVAKLQSIWGQIRTVALVAALYGHNVDDKTIRHRILFCVLWSDKKLSLENNDEDRNEKKQSRKKSSELIRRALFYFGPSVQIEAQRTWCSTKTLKHSRISLLEHHARIQVQFVDLLS